VSVGVQHRMFSISLIIIIIIIIDNYIVNCSFSATLNLIFVRTRIVMRSLESGIKD
jgi:hypothetical protein